jgi:hypothetical protein
MTKIVFSDGTIQCFRSSDPSLCAQLKEATSDSRLRALLEQHQASLVPCEESEATEAQCAVDLLKKKQSGVKRMKKAFGGR